MNYDEVIVVKIKTCCNNFMSCGFDPWRSNDFDPCRSNDVNRSSDGVELRSGSDRSVRRQPRKVVGKRE